jgi:hypothetical protein
MYTDSIISDKNVWILPGNFLISRRETLLILSDWEQLDRFA